MSFYTTAELHVSSWVQKTLLNFINFVSNICILIDIFHKTGIKYMYWPHKIYFLLRHWFYLMTYYVFIEFKSRRKGCHLEWKCYTTLKHILIFNLTDFPLSLLFKISHISSIKNKQKDYLMLTTIDHYWKQNNGFCGVFHIKAKIRRSIFLILYFEGVGRTGISKSYNTKFFILYKYREYFIYFLK